VVRAASAPRAMAQTGGRLERGFGSCEAAISTAPASTRGQGYRWPRSVYAHAARGADEDVDQIGQSAEAGHAGLSARIRPECGHRVNFAGGRGGRNRTCPTTNARRAIWSDAAGKFGRTARVPTLWNLTQNDTFSIQA